jgi:predicted chitinase
MKYLSIEAPYTPSKITLIAAATLLLASCGSGSNDDGVAGTQAGSNSAILAAKAWASTSACGSETWTAGKYYSVGSIVKYPANGRTYQTSHSNPGYDPTISTWYWSAYSCETGLPMASSNSTTTVTSASTTTSSVATVVSDSSTTASSSVVSETQFNQMFPNRNSFYTYAGFVAAINSYPGVFSMGSEMLRKQEAAAFLANVNHETGGLQYIREANQANWPLYCANSSQYPCVPNQQYYGRGPIQLSWNYNYGAAGAVLGLNLLADPDLVARDSTVAWKTAMWFWMTQKGVSQMTPHDAMVNLVGFAETIKAINGGLECNKAPGSVGNNQMQSRVNYYRNFTQLLGVPMGNNLTC